jgi:hypothetical protein
VFSHAEHLLEQAMAAAGLEEGPALLNLSAFLIESRNLTYESRFVVAFIQQLGTLLATRFEFLESSQGAAVLLQLLAIPFVLLSAGVYSNLSRDCVSPLIWQVGWLRPDLSRHERCHAGKSITASEILEIQIWF